jgi:hypothetical protein
MEMVDVYLFSRFPQPVGYPKEGHHSVRALPFLLDIVLWDVQNEGGLILLCSLSLSRIEK